MLCPSCKTEKEPDAFPFRNKAKGLRQHNCKECYKIIRKRNYQKYTKQTIADVQTRKRGIAKRLLEYKLTLKCSVCSENDPACMDFHHLDPAEKDFSLAASANLGLSWKKIERELSKCIPLCRNCHAKYHAYGIHIL